MKKFIVAALVLIATGVNYPGAYKFERKRHVSGGNSPSGAASQPGAADPPPDTRRDCGSSLRVALLVQHYESMRRQSGQPEAADPPPDRRDGIAVCPHNSSSNGGCA